MDIGKLIDQIEPNVYDFGASILDMFDIICNKYALFQYVKKLYNNNISIDHVINRYQKPILTMYDAMFLYNFTPMINNEGPYFIVNVEISTNNKPYNYVLLINTNLSFYVQSTTISNVGLTYCDWIFDDILTFNLLKLFVLTFVHQTNCSNINNIEKYINKLEEFIMKYVDFNKI